MTIQNAIFAAKSSYNWSIVPHEPTTVSVRYRIKGGTLLEIKKIITDGRFANYLEDLNK